MKRVGLKRIIIASVIGLACSLLSLVYAKTIVLDRSGTCHTLSCPQVVSESAAEARGFPLWSLVTLQDDGEDESVTEVIYIFAIGNWLVYSTIAFIGLLFWRPKVKRAQDTPHR